MEAPPDGRTSTEVAARASPRGAAWSGLIPSGPIRSPPTQRASENLVRKSGATTRTPRVPADGTLAPSTGFPARLTPVPNHPSVTRDTRDTEGLTTGQSLTPNGVLVPHAHTLSRSARGGGGGTGGVLVHPSRQPPTPLRESEEEEEDEARAPLVPQKTTGSISHEPIAPRHSRENRRLPLVSPASRNCSSGTATKCHPLPMSPTLQRGDAI